jgi:hypothetical protein
MEDRLMFQSTRPARGAVRIGVHMMLNHCFLTKPFAVLLGRLLDNVREGDDNNHTCQIVPDRVSQCERWRRKHFSSAGWHCECK